MVAEKDQLRSAVQVMCDVSNWPERLMYRLLGTDMSKPVSVVVEAVWAAGFRKVERSSSVIDILEAHQFDSVGRSCSCGKLCGVVCDNLTHAEHVADELAKVRYADKAHAYDAGFRACAKEFMRQRQDPTHPITRTNPYLLP